MPTNHVLAHARTANKIIVRKLRMCGCVLSFVSVEIPELYLAYDAYFHGADKLLDAVSLSAVFYLLRLARQHVQQEDDN